MIYDLIYWLIFITTTLNKTKITFSPFKPVPISLSFKVSMAPSVPLQRVPTLKCFVATSAPKHLNLSFAQLGNLPIASWITTFKTPWAVTCSDSKTEPGLSIWVEGSDSKPNERVLLPQLKVLVSCKCRVNLKKNKHGSCDWPFAVGICWGVVLKIETGNNYIDLSLDHCDCLCNSPMKGKL